MKNKWNICNSYYLTKWSYLLQGKKENWGANSTWTVYDKVILKIDRFFESIYRIPEVLRLYKEYGSCPSRKDSPTSVCNLRGCYDFVMGNIESRWFYTMELFDFCSCCLEQDKVSRKDLLSGDCGDEVTSYFSGFWGVDPKEDIDIIDWIVENCCEEGFESFYYCG